jgi:predicted flap endonuclease-1-like 5' DNA nuclease
MWPICTVNNALWLLLPLLLGLLTGWWAFARRSTGGLSYAVPEPAPVARPVIAPVAEPVVAKPVVRVAEPVAKPLVSGLTGSVTGAVAATGVAVVAATAVAKAKSTKATAAVKAAPVKAVAKKAAPKAVVAKAVIAKVAKPKAAVKTAAPKLTAIGIPAAIGKADDLLQIKGVGPKLNQLLVGLGISRFDQIAKWGAGEISKVDGHLGSFKGRIVRDQWVEQSGLLARGAIAEFEAKFGKLDSENQ